MNADSKSLEPHDELGYKNYIIIMAATIHINHCHLLLLVDVQFNCATWTTVQRSAEKTVPRYTVWPINLCTTI